MYFVRRYGLCVMAMEYSLFRIEIEIEIEIEIKITLKITNRLK